MVERKIQETETIVKALPPLATEPAPLGLVGLAVAALVIGVTYLGLTAPTKTLLIPWVLFFGATAQLIAGLMEFKRNNIFGSTVFTIYAMTMYSIAVTLCILFFTGAAFDIKHYAFGLVGILIFSMIATVASLLTTKAFVAIMVVVDIAVACLLPHYFVGFSSIPAGFFLILTSILSFYTAAAILINTMLGKSLIPLGKPLWNVNKNR
ncbi:MAG: acetate uptake transporter [Candidatus Thermoplasmatota archaeon]